MGILAIFISSDLLDSTSIVPAKPETTWNKKYIITYATWTHSLFTLLQFSSPVSRCNLFGWCHFVLLLPPLLSVESRACKYESCTLTNSVYASVMSLKRLVHNEYSNTQPFWISAKKVIIQLLLYPRKIQCLKVINIVSTEHDYIIHTIHWNTHNNKVMLMTVTSCSWRAIPCIASTVTFLAEWRMARMAFFIQSQWYFRYSGFKEIWRYTPENGATPIASLNLLEVVCGSYLYTFSLVYSPVHWIITNPDQQITTKHDIV